MGRQGNRVSEYSAFAAGVRGGAIHSMELYLGIASKGVLRTSLIHNGWVADHEQHHVGRARARGPVGSVVVAGPWVLGCEG